AFPQFVGVFVGIQSEDADGPRVPFPQPLQHFNGSGFSRSVGTQDPEDFTGLHREADIPDGVRVRVSLVQMLRHNGRFHSITSFDPLVPTSGWFLADESM